MTKQKKIPIRVQRIIDRCRGGEKVCKFLRLKENGAKEEVFFYEPAGGNIGPKSAAAAISMGAIVPLGDGLFGDQDSQTFIASSEFDQ